MKKKHKNKKNFSILRRPWGPWSWVYPLLTLFSIGFRLFLFSPSVWPGAGVAGGAARDACFPAGGAELWAEEGKGKARKYMRPQGYPSHQWIGWSHSLLDFLLIASSPSPSHTRWATAPHPPPASCPPALAPVALGLGHPYRWPSLRHHHASFGYGSGPSKQARLPLPAPAANLDTLLRPGPMWKIHSRRGTA